MIIHDDMTDIGDEGEVKLPTLVPGIRPAYSTPLPALPMAVLCIVSRAADIGDLANAAGDAVRAIVCESVHALHPEDGGRCVSCRNDAEVEADDQASI